MNKFEKYISSHSEFIAKGSSRKAFMLNGKIFKIPYSNHSCSDEQTQANKEEEIYNKLEDKFKEFFPNPKFLGRTIQLDYVSELGIGYAEEYDSTFHSSKCSVSDSTGYESFLDYFLELKGIANEIIDDLIDEIDKMGGYISDIVDNPNNFGVDENGKFKIIDWGW